MDNQKDQFGTTPDQTKAGRNTGSNSPAPTGGAAAASRKPVATPNAQAAAPTTPDNQPQPTANARQGEGQPTNAPEGTLLDTALNSGKKWIEDSGVLDSVNQLPQSLKDLGNRALGKVTGLSTAQKVVGGAILAGGIAWLATRKGKTGSSESSPYNYGRQRDAGSYGRRSYGYQAPDASTSRRPAAGTTGRSDSGSRFGSSSFSSEASGTKSAGSGGIYSGSGRSEGSPSASARADHGTQASDRNSSRAKEDGFRSVE